MGATCKPSADVAAKPTITLSEAANKVLATAGPTLSVPETAKVFGISRDTAYALAARDELGVRVLRLGRSMRVPTADVRRLLLGDEAGVAVA